MIVIGILPVLLPTTYLRWSPLAVPAVYIQGTWLQLHCCEVCGAQASKSCILPYEAEMDRFGGYVEYDPREWPGNSEIHFCAPHRHYPDLCVPYRLGRGALVYLLVFGANGALRLMFILHCAILTVGILILAIPQKSKTAAQFTRAGPKPEDGSP